MNKQAALAVAFVGALVVPVSLTASASASGGGDDGVERAGSCSGSTDWKLKAKFRDGRIETEGEIDSNRIGQTWNWVLKHNGSFEVERKIVNLPGVDTIVFTARNPRSGETCRGVVRI